MSFVPNLSVSFLKSATRLAKKSSKIEMKNKEWYPHPNLDLKNNKKNNKKVCELAEETECYSIASVVYAVMFIEAYINEIFCKAKFEKTDDCFSLLSDRIIVERLANLWEIDMQTPNQSKSTTYSILDDLKPTILEKYQLALTVSDKELFHTGENLYQNIKILIDLRNAIVHYKPERWGNDIETSNGWQHNKLQNKLRGKITTINPFIEETNNPFFPDKCFGYGCAKWAVQSSVEFVKEFSTKMELKVFPKWFKKAQNLP